MLLFGLKDILVFISQYKWQSTKWCKVLDCAVIIVAVIFYFLTVYIEIITIGNDKIQNIIYSAVKLKKKIIIIFKSIE